MRRSGHHAVRRVGVIAGVLALLVTAIASASSGTTVGTHHTKHGKVLASKHGFSLYLFVKDKGTKSTCYGQCAVIWPPLLTTSKPSAARFSGVDSKKLGTTRRKSGKLEVTYNGHPLYLYQPDHKPGDTFGQNVNQFGAKWYLVNTAGNAVKPQCPSGFVPSPNGCVPGTY